MTKKASLGPKAAGTAKKTPSAPTANRRAKKVAPVPKGYRNVTPQLVVRGAQAAIAFYQDVFGAEVVKRVLADDGVTLLHSEIKIGNTMLRLCDEMPVFGILSPLCYGTSASCQHVYMADADEIWERALAAGAVVLMAYEDRDWGERFGRFVDPYGHIWSLARRIPSPKPAQRGTLADASSLQAIVLPAEDEDATQYAA